MGYQVFGGGLWAHVMVKAVGACVHVNPPACGGSGVVVGGKPLQIAAQQKQKQRSQQDGHRNCHDATVGKGPCLRGRLQSGGSRGEALAPACLMGGNTYAAASAARLGPEGHRPFLSILAMRWSGG